VLGAPGRRGLACVVSAALLLFASACSFPAPEALPAARAEELAAERCGSGAIGARAAGLLDASEIVSVAPLHREERKGKVSHRILVGAQLRVAAAPGITEAWFQRVLECHQADVLLARASPLRDDPFAVQDRWLDIAVRRAGSSMLIEVRTDNAGAAEELLGRARRLASRGPSAPGEL
jgi:hypothetical protein